MKRRPVFSLLALLTGLILLLLPAVLRPEGRLIYNPSPSAEVGWYRVYPGAPVERGFLVASQLPDDARRLADMRGYLPSGVPVIKTVGGVAGDEICRDGNTVALPDGARLLLQDTDSLGRPLPQLQSACFTLPDETLFLVSTRTETSFDSRYIGPVHASLVIGPVHASLVIGPVRCVGRRDVQGSAHSADWAWARAPGADCKIKAGGAAMGATPCLHIIFHGAIRDCAALTHFRYLCVFKVLGQRYFTGLHLGSPGRHR